jgi:hypothetical protein
MVYLRALKPFYVFPKNVPYSMVDWIFSALSFSYGAIISLTEAHLNQTQFEFSQLKLTTGPPHNTFSRSLSSVELINFQLFSLPPGEPDISSPMSVLSKFQFYSVTTWIVYCKFNSQMPIPRYRTDTFFITYFCLLFLTAVVVCSSKKSTILVMK